MKDYLNLGCGNSFHPDWVNIDFVSNHPAVIVHDLTAGIPYADESFAVVYHSHVLEHFSRNEAIKLIAECYRVLKPGGIIRVLVPDLQQLAEQYLSMLAKAEQSSTAINEANYEWAVIEMIDQMVRQQSGGEMLAYWQQERILNEDLLIERMGNQFLSFRQIKDQVVPPPVASTEKKKWWIRKKRINPEISFENTGEKHKWMYDRHSLKLLLASWGFVQIQVRTGVDSLIPGWEQFRFLDVEEGKLRKPDSLIMEAIKPAR